MKFKHICGAAAAGLGAGIINGLFGAGGGMVLIPLLELLTDTNEETRFSSSLAIILPISVISLVAAARATPIPWADALPYLPGSAGVHDHRRYLLIAQPGAIVYGGRGITVEAEGKEYELLRCELLGGGSHWEGIMKLKAGDENAG